MAASTLIGYARCSTDKQDLEAQTDALEQLGVNPKRIFTDQGFTGRNRERPGLEQALKALRAGDTFVVTKLDRMGRSVPDLRDIATEIESESASLSINGQIHDPADAIGRLFFNILATFAEFESDLISQRTKEGMKIASRKGKLKGGPPKLNETQLKELNKMHATGEYTGSELAAIFNISRATVYRNLN